MSGGDAGEMAGQLDRLFHQGTLAGLGEARLLERFIDRRDEAAFTALVALHGPMVLGVCRRILGDDTDAEDAFQATFLVLVRRARAIRNGDLVGHWLYGVAHKVAARARALAARRRGREQTGTDLALAGADPSDEDERRELRAVLDEELARLPESLRAPMVLCYLEGLTHDEAARRLHWPVGTVRSRMARARDLLRRRLARRGLVASSAAMTTAIAAEPVRAGLLDSTVHVSLDFATHRAPAACLASAKAAALAKGVIHAMTLSQLKVIGASALACVLVLGGVQTFAFQYGGLGGMGGAVATNKAAGDRHEALIQSVSKLQTDLADSAKRIANLQEELQALRNELEALRSGAPSAETQTKTSVVAKAKAAAEKSLEDQPAGKGYGRMMRGMGPMMGRGGGMGGGMAGSSGMMGMMAGQRGMMGRGGMPGMGAGMANMMGMMGGGMAAGMSNPEDENRLHYVRNNQLVVVASPDGDKVTAYSIETGRTQTIRLSGTKNEPNRVIPVVGGEVVGLAIEGPKITRVAAFSAQAGTWHPLDLRAPVENAQPVVANQVVSYSLPGHIYAFSGVVNRWDILDLPEGVDPQPIVDNQGVLFEHDGHLYIFSISTGKWKDINTRDIREGAEEGEAGTIKKDEAPAPTGERPTPNRRGRRRARGGAGDAAGGAAPESES